MVLGLMTLNLKLRIFTLHYLEFVSLCDEVHMYALISNCKIKSPNIITKSGVRDSWKDSVCSREGNTTSQNFRNSSDSLSKSLNNLGVI